MFVANNAYRILPVTIARVLVSLIRNRAEHRMWSSAGGSLCIVYRDPAGHLIAVTEDWTQPHATRIYQGCDVDPSNLARRHIVRESGDRS